MHTRARDYGAKADDRNAAALEQAATEWFFRRDRGLTRDEKTEFARWLGVGEHESVFAEVESSWTELGRLSEPAGRYSTVKTSSVTRHAAPRPRRIAEVIWLRTALVAAAALLAFGFFLSRHSSETSNSRSQIVSADRGTTRTVRLPDGSSVQLNTETEIEIRFTSTERGVRLARGEAHFTVAKNPALPFIVRVGEMGVRAVGTAFNVRMRPGMLEVLVTEGSVRVISAQTSPQSVASDDPASQLPVVIAGERALIPVRVAQSNTPISVVAVPAGEIEQALSWHKRRLEYADASLEEIVADFNRYNAHRLIIADPRLATRRFGATFPSGDYDSLVRLLESTFGVIAERRESETVLRLP